MKKQNKLRQTKSRRTVITCFKKLTCKAIVMLKVLGTCVKMLQNEDAVKNNVLNRYLFIK